MEGLVELVAELGRRRDRGSLIEPLGVEQQAVHVEDDG